MKTIKIIDLLNLVYENKTPKKILYKYCEYEFNEEINDYVNNDNLKLFMYLFEYETDALFKEVEIIEDKIKKIGEINFMTAGTQKEKNRIMKDAINEIIKVLNYLSEKSKGNEQ